MLKKVSEDEVILREDEQTSRMYKIVSGKAVVYIGYGTDLETVVGILSEGAYFGELGVLTDSPSIYTVVAYCDSLILEIEKEEMDNYAKLNYRDLLAIMSHMAGSMVVLKKNVELLTKDIEALMEDRENTMKTQEIKERIRSSDVAKQLARYSIQMGIKL